MKFPGTSGSKRGFALIMTIMGALAVVVLAVEFHFAAWLEGMAVRYHKNGLKASALARSGLELGLYLLQEDEWESDSFEDLWAELDLQSAMGIPLGNGFVTVKIRDESGKINVNMADINEIRTIFRLLSVSRQKKGEITGLLMEGFDHEEGLKKLMKARPLPHVSAMIGVTGYQGYQAGPGLSAVLTTWGDGKINVNTATETALFALKPVQDTGVPERLVAALVGGRPYEKIEDVSALLKRELQIVPDALKGVFRVNSEYFRIIATGTADEVVSSVEAVILRSEKEGLRMASWSE